MGKARYNYTYFRLMRRRHFVGFCRTCQETQGRQFMRAGGQSWLSVPIEFDDYEQLSEPPMGTDVSHGIGRTDT